MSVGLTVGQANSAYAKLREQRQAALRKAREISEDAAAGRRSDNAETESAYQRAMNEVERLNKLIEAARSDLDDAREERGRASAISASMTRAGVQQEGANVPVAEARYGRPLAKSQGFADLAGTTRTPEEAGAYLRALLRDDVEARATMTEGSGPNGGYLVPIEYSSPLLDLARAKSRIAQLGASVIPLESNETRVPVHASDPIFNFRSEAAAVVESGTTLGQMVMIPRMASTLVRASMELVEDSQFSFEDYVAQMIAEAAAVTLDAKALYGTGTAPDVRGIKNTAGVVVTNHVGANGGPLANHDALVDLVGRVRGKGYEVTGLLGSPRTEASIAKFREGAGTGQYLAPPKYLTDLPFLTSTNVLTNLTVGTGTNTTDVFAGDWSKLYVGVRHALSVTVLREKYADTGEFGFIAHIRFDVQVSRPAALELLSGITN